jgi:hypothetical protein
MNKSRKSRESDIPAAGWLEKCSEADFDGHSQFASFTPQQRLEWLARAADLLIALKRRSKSSSSQRA